MKSNQNQGDLVFFNEEPGFPIFLPQIYVVSVRLLYNFYKPLKRQDKN